MNKSQPRSADSDAAEAKKNKDWNPNAPLAGKNPVKPAEPAASGEVTSVMVPEPAVVAPPKTVAAPAAAASAAAPAVAPKTAKPAVSADPLGDLAKAKMEAPASGAGADPFTYFKIGRASCRERV